MATSIYKSFHIYFKENLADLNFGEFCLVCNLLVGAMQQGFKSDVQLYDLLGCLNFYQHIYRGKLLMDKTFVV